MAKLDFFVRYPQFFNQLCERLGVTAVSPISSVESSMVRFHYGPGTSGITRSWVTSNQEI